MCNEHGFTRFVTLYSPAMLSVFGLVLSLLHTHTPCNCMELFFTCIFDKFLEVLLILVGPEEGSHSGPKTSLYCYCLCPIVKKSFFWKWSMRMLFEVCKCCLGYESVNCLKYASVVWSMQMLFGVWKCCLKYANVVWSMQMLFGVCNCCLKYANVVLEYADVVWSMQMLFGTIVLQ